MREMSEGKKKIARVSEILVKGCKNILYLSLNVPLNFCILSCLLRSKLRKTPFPSDLLCFLLLCNMHCVASLDFFALAVRKLKFYA